MLGPDPVGSTHRSRPLGARPPGVVDLIGLPNHERRDLRRVRKCNQSLPTDEARGLALCQPVAIEKLPGLVDLIGLGPVMCNNANHDFPYAFAAGSAPVALGRHRGPPLASGPMWFTGSPGNQCSRALSCTPAAGCVGCRRQ